VKRLLGLALYTAGLCAAWDLCWTWYASGAVSGYTRPATPTKEEIGHADR
jgi:hypothetical protein